MKNNPLTNDDEFAIGGKKKVTKQIYDLKIRNSAEVLGDLNVDILGLCEVENIHVLNDLNDAYNDRTYKIIHYDSPDKRGIDNALLYDETKLKVTYSEAITNKLKGGHKTRDVLYVIGSIYDEKIHIFINHWPSNYGGRAKAIPKRKSTASLISKKIEEIQRADSSAEIILLGDFNENPDEENIQSLTEHGLVSLMKPFVNKPKVGTNVYKGKDYLYDQIIINQKLLDQENLYISLESIYILDLPKYRQQEGNYKHYPFRFWAGNRLLGGYSDHLAIRVKIIVN
jgi:predicted extracellular nuclease